MQIRTLLPTIVFLACCAAAIRFAPLVTLEAADGPVFNPKGELELPKGYRRWVFLGAPLTPNALNGGKAGFPEYHNVYVQERNLASYQKTGKFPEGTVIVKELVLLRNSTYPDGSGNTAAGRGYSQGKFNGLDVMVKDSQRFGKTNGWGFFNFGHHAEPYLKAAAAAPLENCAGCHMAGAAKTDMMWAEFYPVLHAKNN